jgi:Predicted permeases
VSFAPRADRLRQTVKLLDRYVELSTLRACVLVAAGLTMLFDLLTFVEQLADVGHGHYQIQDALLYVALTTPAQLLQLIPVSALLGCLLALGGLSSTSELTAMRAAGVSELRILGWVFRLGVPVMLALFLVAEFVVPPAQRLAESDRSSRLGASEALRSDNGFWAHDGHRYLNIRTFAEGFRPRDLWIYRFDDQGRLTRLIHAASAQIKGGRSTWKLDDVIEKVYGDGPVETRRLPTLDWTSFLRPDQLKLLTLPPDSMAPTALLRYVVELRREGQQALIYEQALWKMLVLPLATAAMVLISAPFAFGSLRARNAGQRLTVGVLIGLVFYLGQQISGYLGLLLALPPAPVALARPCFCCCSPFTCCAVSVWRPEFLRPASRVRRAPPDRGQTAGTARAAGPAERP